MFRINSGHLLFVIVITGFVQSGLSDINDLCSWVSRSEWNAKKEKAKSTLSHPISRIFIHHTETIGCNSLASCSRILRSIQNYHMNTKGWDDIGYSFLIGGDGRVYEGRGYQRVGAHTYNFNSESIGISLIGSFDSQPPPESMLTATQTLIECALFFNFVEPPLISSNYTLHGHKDAKCTDCPGQALYNIIKTWDRFKAGPLPGYTCGQN